MIQVALISTDNAALLHVSWISFFIKSKHSYNHTFLVIEYQFSMILSSLTFSKYMYTCT